MCGCVIECLRQIGVGNVGGFMKNHLSTTRFNALDLQRKKKTNTHVAPVIYVIHMYVYIVVGEYVPRTIKF